MLDRRLCCLSSFFFVKHLLAGMQLIRTQRQLWPFVWKPLLASIAAYFVILIGGWFLIVPKLSHWLEQWILGIVAQTIGNVLYALIWIFFSGPIFVGIMGAFSGFLWEKLAVEVEKIHLGEVRSSDPDRNKAILDSIARLGLALFLAVGILFMGSFCFGIVGLVLAGWQGTIEFTGPAFARRGVFLGGQTTRIWKSRSTPGFLVGAGVISLVPLLNALLFPCMVAGGTLLCLEIEERDSLAEAPKPPIDSA